MKRRGFLSIAGRLALGTIAVPLVACNSGGDELDPTPAPPAPTPTPTPPPAGDSVAFGAKLRTATELAAVPAVYGKLSSSGASLPPAIDLRTSGFLPPVGHQGQQPSCVAWALGYASATFLAAQKSSFQPTTAAKQASPADLYAKLQALRPTGCRDGTLLTDAFDILIRDKVASMEVAPYSDSMCAAPRNSRQFGVVGYRRIETGNTQAIKSALANKKVLAIGARVYSDFESFGFGPNKTSIYQPRGSLTNSGHAMALVGYNDASQAYLIMNSWGTNFGDRGFVWFDYQAFGSSVPEVYEADGATADTVNPSPTPQPPPPANVQFSSLVASTQTNPFYNIELLFLNFALSEPLFVNGVSFIYEDVFGVGLPRFQSQNFPVGVWMLQSYVQFWQSLPYRWPPGRYTLVIDGARQSNQRIQVSGSTQYR